VGFDDDTHMLVLLSMVVPLAHVGFDDDTHMLAFRVSPFEQLGWSFVLTHRLLVLSYWLYPAAALLHVRERVVSPSLVLNDAHKVKKKRMMPKMTTRGGGILNAHFFAI
jgi:hypothetical protein